ncbi:MAG: UvrD-helicase domain-containing protein [Desulfobulbaceae bacterium]|nr:UvrD-helicase domain-containing protein [Desulfobulbaceae bacterium]
MEYIADLHIHSPYSRATSKSGHLFGLASWAAVKGIRVIGTGDFTHPEWLSHLVENLEEAEPGFYRLKKEKTASFANVLPAGLEQPDINGIRFVLTAEISSIYKRADRVRKVHNIIVSPDLEAVRRLNASLAGIGNIESDGRPILGLDSRDLLEIVLEKIPGGFLVPAHIWTPWFSLFGSKSGFDAIEECFGDLTQHIFALETGLSSDPEMNRHISALDRFTLISNSDCHSPGKLGREANIFTTGFDFHSMRQAIRSPTDASGHRHFAATVEFYPEEGKYHCDGHRKCHVCMEPAETRKVKGICPLCGRPVTVGVLHRVMELADRQAPVYPAGSPGVHSLVPLPEILSELLGTGPATKRVTQAYVKLIQQFGSEFDILLKAPIEDLGTKASSVLAEAIQRVRTGRVIRRPGYDGEFGVIRVFSEGERSSFAGQLHLFGTGKPAGRKPAKRSPQEKQPSPQKNEKKPVLKKKLNPEQQAAVASDARHIIVKAGPGTGKTHTLVQRVIRLVRQANTPCTVITFTNKAADELQQRLHAELGRNAPVSTATLHGYCLRRLRHENPDLRVAGPEMRRRLLKAVYGVSGNALKEIDGRITEFLQSGAEPAACPASLQPYFTALAGQNHIDIDAVVPMAGAILRSSGPAAERMKRETGALFIDEFQDLNQSQYELVHLLAASSPVFAIGDPYQAIYGFRGSSPVWFGRFIESLQPEQHVLHRNYRSAACIVDASHAVIQKNGQAAFPARPESAAALQGSIFIHRSPSPHAEAGFVVREIESLIGGSSHREIDRLHNAPEKGVTLAEIAVLYRTARQAEVLAEVLAGHGFPVQVVDIKPFYRSGPAQFLYLWTLAAAGRTEAADILALLELEKKISRSERDALEQIFPIGLQNPLDALGDLEDDCPAKLFALLLELRDFTEELRTAADREEAAVLPRIIARYDLDTEDMDIVRFFRLAENFSTSLAAFADHLKRYNDSVVYDERAECVPLMTIHAAKGLEFPVVFLVGLEEGLLPLTPRGNLSREEIEEHTAEERRLFYVGMTRAARILYLSSAENRQVKGEMIQQLQSRFVEEIPAGYCTTLREERRIYKHRVKQLSLF